MSKRVSLQTLVLTLASALASFSAYSMDTSEMVSVPGGYFHMGCNKSVDPDCFESEMPLRRVWIKGFKIDKYEVTFGRYQKCIDDGYCEDLGIGGSCNYFWPGVENKPVNCVTWYKAKNFCEYEGKRLPTEAEWEKAARANTVSLYPWGNKKPSCDLAAMDGPNGGNLACGEGTAPEVGSKPNGASPYGAMDMAGSMWEWVSDWYGHYYYYSASNNNPKGPRQGAYKVARGGDIYARKPEELRTVTRFFYAPENFSPAVGFRCAQ
ncbi:SUMF1/EgtB/PvdO family nonheme iron enzyme [Maricurvus nonylphenolicus]|uniref:formylglycine-generating enzyme family protein n=1 Tax=Maricurvus nonylphenolicus TaxID=1008307 RepID=UPI0036F1A8EB